MTISSLVYHECALQLFALPQRTQVLMEVLVIFEIFEVFQPITRR